MKFDLRKKSFWLSAVIGIFAMAAAVYALTFYRINHGQFLTLTGADSINWWVHNYSTALDYFIPNNSVAEWNAFRNAADSYLSNDLRVERTTDLADLRPYFVSSPPAEIPTYGYYTYNVRARNYGPGTSENLTSPCRLTPTVTWLDGTPVGAGLAWFYGYLTRPVNSWVASGLVALAPNTIGGSTLNPDRSNVCPVGQEGDHPEGNILFTVDACHNNPDSDYSNNTVVLAQRCCGGPGATVNSAAKCCAGLTYSSNTCYAPVAPMPDLVIAIGNPQVLIDPHAPGEVFNVQMITRNNGSGSSAISQTTVSMPWLVGGSTQNFSIPILAPGAEQVTNLSLQCPPSGNVISGITINADTGTPPGGQFSANYEMNEYNNNFWQGMIRCGNY